MTKIKFSQLNLLIITAICVIIAIAIIEQIFFNELPCALCNLLRMAFIIVAGGLLMQINLMHNLKIKYGYFIAGISSVIGALIALIQIFVHIMPNVAPTGSAIFGLHMYGCCFIIFTTLIVYCLGVSCLDSNNNNDKVDARVIELVSVVLISITLVCCLSAILENGFSSFLPGGQQHYWISEVVKNHSLLVNKEILMDK